MTDFERCKCVHMKDEHINGTGVCIYAKCRCIAFEFVPRNERLRLPGESYL